MLRKEGWYTMRRPRCTRRSGTREREGEYYVGHWCSLRELGGREKEIMTED